MAYNGWANYETWLVGLWIDNDEGSQQFWADRAQELVDDDMDTAERTLADELKDQFEQDAEAMGATGFWADLIGAALSEVDWDEIAAHYVSDVVPTTEDE